MRTVGTTDHRYRNDKCPCDACPQQARCFLSEISCKDFSTYVESSKVIRDVRQPSRRRFAKLMGSDALGGENGI